MWLDAQWLESLYEPYQLVAGCKYNSLPEANLSSNS